LKLYLLSFLLIFCQGFSFGQIDTINVKDENEYFIQTIEECVKLFYEDYTTRSSKDSIEKILQFESGVVPEYPDSIICQRLSELNEKSAFHLDCNPSTLSVIRLFANKKRGFMKIVLGRSYLYFDLYESKLAEYDLPYELKYLSVIESGLRPQIKSRAGALGLWQFMYRTGKYFGLKENSYIDERMDPYKATDAACRYLKKLHGIYGDWNLALAAYNAGPGNVNKAIRRSGNKKTYWEVRPFLPRETQGYVPNFIAATYVMEYYKEHNLMAVNPKTQRVLLDTICLQKSVHMATISRLMNWDIETIKEYNPIYKREYIPKATPNSCILMPVEMSSRLAGLEDSLYSLEQSIYNPKPIVDTSKNNASSIKPFLIHSVKSKETLTSIAKKYSTHSDSLSNWNNLTSTNLLIGQKLKIYISKSYRPNEVQTNTTTRKKKYHYVKSGQNLTVIAKRYGISLRRIKSLNPRVNPNKLMIGQKLRVR
tara:strand:+ start:961 stop:2403 length:1443 start_codon:yes stop_codon:yes gene_type:complete